MTNFIATIEIKGTGKREAIIKSLKEIATNLESLPPAIGMSAKIKMEDETVKCTYEEKNEQ